MAGCGLHHFPRAKRQPDVAAIMAVCGAPDFAQINNRTPPLPPHDRLRIAPLLRQQGYSARRVRFTSGQRA